jgi:hypothetical protein
MRTVTYKCPVWIVVLLLAGSIAPLALLPVMPVFEGAPAARASLIVAGLAIALYALTLLPTKLLVSDEGLRQKLLFSELRLRWEDIVEWRHCEGGADFEQGDLRATTRNRLHSMEFWVRDRSGTKHYFKRWLVFGRRSKEIADLMRAKGVPGG